jgi:hypothetical protein
MLAQTTCESLEYESPLWMIASGQASEDEGAGARLSGSNASDRWLQAPAN